MDNKGQCDALLDYLQENDNDLRDTLEIIGNLLVQLGCDSLDPKIAPGKNSDVLAFVTEHRSRYGETLAHAMVFQGLIILNWLNE